MYVDLTPGEATGVLLLASRWGGGGWLKAPVRDAAVARGSGVGSQGGSLRACEVTGSIGDKAGRALLMAIPVARNG